MADRQSTKWGVPPGAGSEANRLSWLQLGRGQPTGAGSVQPNPLFAGREVGVGAFQLTSNPFALLCVSVRDGRDAILSAYEEAVAEGTTGEHDLLRAQQCLTASKPRLRAEVSWLCDVAPSRVASIVEGLRREPVPAESRAWLEELTGLARANLAAHLCGRGTDLSSFVEDLISAHGEIDTDSIVDSLNAARALAGFPKVDSALVSEAVAALREEHCAAALDAIFTAAHPGLRMTELVAGSREHDNLIGNFVEELVEGFDRRCSGKFRAIEDGLRAAEARVRQDPTSGASATEITELLAEWDEYSQPRQLVFQAKGLDEPRSRQVYNLLRALCLWLANEQNAYAPAMTIVRALQDTFPELPSVVAQISEDLTTLEDLVAQQGAAEVLAPLLAVIQEARENPTRLPGSLRQLGPTGTGLGGRLYASFEESVAASQSTDYQAMPWLALRSLAIDLNNEHDLPRVSLALLEMLLAKRAAKPPDTLAAKLAEDRQTVRENLLAADLASSLKAGDLNRALGLSQSLASEASDRAARAQMATTRDAIQRQINSRRLKWFGWGAFGLFILWAIAQDNGTPRSSRSPADTRAAPSVVANAPARDLGGEVRPPAAREHTHSRGEIRYCLFQEQRLEGMRPLTLTDADVGRFNQLVEDWNSRCSSYRYFEQDLGAVRGEAQVKQAELRQQGLSMLPSFAALDRTQAVRPPGSVRLGDVLLSPYSPSDARLIQQRLKEMGHYRMSPDGDWGRGSQDALQSFKRSAGLPENDVWDVDTQRRLFAGTQY